MATRTKISVKPAAPERDPRRTPVRGINTLSRKKSLPREDTRSADPRNANQGQAPRTAAPRSPPPGRPPRSADASRESRPPRAEPPTRGPQERFDRVDRSERPAPRPAQRPAPRTSPDRPQRPGPGLRQPPVDRPLPSPMPSAPRHRAAPPVPHAEGSRVAKLMTDRGMASRREADDWIAAGWVRVNGRLAVLGQRADADALIEVDARASAEQARRVTVLLNKPIGFVSGQAEDGHEPAVVLVTRANRWPGDESGIELTAGHLRHLAPAGRLDIDSTGLLVLTQDGRVAKRLIGDQTRVEKEYLVRVVHMHEGPVPETTLNRLRHGLVLDDVELRPARVSWQNEDQLRIVLREGRKRQIRRMCELVGLQVVGLKRVRIGSVVLGPLPPGQWRFLRDDEGF
jgi:23S rRNA pseudouridine2604 synthase